MSGFSTIKVGEEEVNANDFINQLAKGELVEKDSSKEEESTPVETEKEGVEQPTEKLVETPAETEKDDNTETPVETPAEEKEEYDYLGYGSKDKLAKSFEHKETHLKRLEEENRELRKNKKESSTESKKTDLPEHTKLEMPPLKKFDEDLLDEDDVKNKKANEEATRTTMEKMVERINLLEDNNKKQVEENRKQQETIDSIAYKEIEKKAKQEDENYWKSIESLRADNKDYNSDPDVKIVEVHKKIKQWELKLGSDNGVNQPYDDDPTEWAEYNGKIADLKNRALDNDPNVISTKPPKGSDDYFKLATLVDYRNKLISEGTLGKTSTLKAANAILLDQSGALQQNVKEEAEKAFKKGKLATDAALTESEQTYAKTVQSQTPKKLEVGNSESDLIRRALSYTIDDLADPEKKNEFDRAQKIIGMI